MVSHRDRFLPLPSHSPQSPLPLPAPIEHANSDEVEVVVGRRGSCEGEVWMDPARSWTAGDPQSFLFDRAQIRSWNRPYKVRHPTRPSDLADHSGLLHLLPANLNPRSPLN